MSPYAVSKVYGDYLFRNYFYTYGLKGIVSRAFNHEGAGRGIQFVTSVITSQVSHFRCNEADKITIGNVNAFRDWSHIDDIVHGYELLAMKGKPGDVYNQGSNRTTSVLSYILHSIEACGMPVKEICTTRTGKCLKDPLEPDNEALFGAYFEKSKVDRMILDGTLDFGPQDGGILVRTAEKTIPIEFDLDRFRPSDVPILFADIRKIKQLGYEVRYQIRDIVQDQMNFYMDPENRCSIHTIERA